MPHLSRWFVAIVVCGVFGLAYLFQPQPPMWLVSATIGIVLLQLWNGAAALDDGAKRYPTKKFLAQLFDTKPIEAKHKAPRTIEEGTSVPSCVTDADRRFFADFDLFGHLMNSLDGALAPTPWRLQETGRTNLSWSDDPVHGRHYEVFYNQAKIGRLEVGACVEYDDDNPKVSADIELEHLRILPCGDVQQLLTTIAHFCWAPTAREYAEAQRWIDHALLCVIWDTPPWGLSVKGRRIAPDLPDDPLPFSVHRSGSASAYLEVRQYHARPKARQRVPAR